MKKGIFFLLAVLLAATLVLGACSSDTTTTTKPAATTSGAKYGGTLRLSRYTSEGVSIGDPLNHRGMNSWYMASPCLETLLRADDSGALIPWLAESWKEDVATKSITLTIRKGVKFHDGSALNADVVAWNLQYRMDGKMSAMKMFSAVQVVDEYNVKISLVNWDSTILGNLASGPGMMISKENYEKNGADYAANNPVGTGPFKFVEWKKNDYISYEKNTDYWQSGKPYLDKVIWYTIPDMNTKTMSFLSGELEVVLTMDLPQIQTINAAGIPTLHQAIGSGADGYVFSSANASSPWYDVRVRQAAMYAINTEEYTKALFGDEAAPANQLVGKASWAYSNEVAGYPYNVDKAKQLLKEAGYPEGFDSVIYGSQDQTVNKRALAVQDYLKKVGINLEVEIISDAQNREMYSQGVGWEGLIGASLGQSTDVVDTVNRYYAGGGMMFASMATPADYLQSIKDAVAAPDFANKQAKTKEMMKMFVDKYCLMLILDTRFDNGFEQPYVRNSGILKGVNTQMWTPEDCWLDK